MTEEIIKIVATVLQAIAIIVTAIFASRGLHAWRAQMVGKRKFEIAEETLLAAYKVKNAMSYIRSPGAFGGEGRTRPRGEPESEDPAGWKDTYFVPLERIQKTSNDFAEFEKVRLLCQVYFGSDSTKPFDNVLRARHKVAVAARMLISTAGQRGVERNLIERWEGEIWESYGSGGDPGTDEIVKAVSEAVGEIEALCGPHLKT